MHLKHINGFPLPVGSSTKSLTCLVRLSELVLISRISVPSLVITLLCPSPASHSGYVCLYDCINKTSVPLPLGFWAKFSFHVCPSCLSSSTLCSSSRGNAISLGWPQTFSSPDLLRSPGERPCRLCASPLYTILPENTSWAWHCYLLEKHSSEGNRRESLSSSQWHSSLHSLFHTASWRGAENMSVLFAL